VTRTLILVVVCLLAVIRPDRAAAQIRPDGVDTAPLHLGPVGLTPKLAIRNLGVDTNVFNAAEAPERDATATVAPGVDARLRIGRLHLASETTAEWNYFQQATNERSLNLGEQVRLDVDLFRLVPFATGRYVRTRQRPSLEIDERVLQLRSGGGAGVIVRAGARLELEAFVEQERLDLGQTRFGSAALAGALNRTRREGAVTARYEVTPLTTFVVRASTRHDRFEIARLRDSDSFSLEPGFTFSPSALFSGTASVGFRRFRTLAASAPDYAGLVAAVDLKYVARDMTRFVVAIGRDVEYSFEPAEPFFVSTFSRLEVTQLIGYSWDVVGRGSLATLDYEHLAGEPVAAGRTDRLLGYGVGMGRRFGDSLRIGVDVDVARRTSPLRLRTYDGMRVGGSITYGY
jgi:hypothetical protein